MTSEQRIKELCAELWGLLCPDMGPEDWEQEVRDLAISDGLFDEPLRVTKTIGKIRGKFIPVRDGGLVTSEDK